MKQHNPTTTLETTPIFRVLRSGLIGLMTLLLLPLLLSCVTPPESSATAVPRESATVVARGPEAQPTLALATLAPVTQVALAPIATRSAGLAQTSSTPESGDNLHIPFITADKPGAFSSPSTTALAQGSRAPNQPTQASTPTARPTSTTTLMAPPTATTRSVPATPPPPPTPAPPPPTPTPRIKSQPAYKTLQDYPRPAGDTGFGFHISAEPHVPRKAVLESEIVPILKSLGATWVTVWASSDHDEELEGIKYLADSGFEVIVRYHDMSRPPHPDWLPEVSALQRIKNAGAHYIVTGNEPNLTIENPSHGNAELIAKQWIISSDRVKSVGAIPLLYPMSPGGAGDVADARLMLIGILDYLKANDALDSLDGAGVSIHNRPLGKPLEVRDSTSFLEYEWIDDTVASYIGKHIPLLGTEAGYSFGEQVLSIYPRVDGELHKQYNGAIIDGFRDARWRDSLFTQTFWLLSGFGHDQFLADWWIGNKLNYGKDLPIVEALKARPKAPRTFKGQGFR